MNYQVKSSHRVMERDGGSDNVLESASQLLHRPLFLFLKVGRCNLDKSLENFLLFSVPALRYQDAGKIE